MNLRETRAWNLVPGDLFFTNEVDRYDMATCVYIRHDFPDVIVGFLDVGTLREESFDKDRTVHVVNVEEKSY